MTARRERKQLISIAEAAAYVGVSTKSVRRYIADGRLTAYRVGPRFIRVDAAEVDRMIRPIATAGGGS